MLPGYIHDTYEEDEIEVIYLFGDWALLDKRGLEMAAQSQVCS